MNEDIREYSGNIKVNQFNDLTSEECHEKETVIDIAIFQSILPSGERVIFSKGQERYFLMTFQHPYDGNHLIKIRRKNIAEKLL